MFEIFWNISKISVFVRTSEVYLGRWETMIELLEEMVKG